MTDIHDAVPLSVRDTVALTPAVTSVIHCDVVATTGESLDVSRVAAWMRERLDCWPMFTRTLRHSWGHAGLPHWVTDPSVDVAAHIRVVDGGEPAGAERIVAELVSTPVDLSRPPWDLTVITGVTGMGLDYSEPVTLVVLRTHHAAGDGTKIAAVMRRAMRDEPVPAPAVPGHRPPGNLRSALSIPAALVRHLAALPGLSRHAANLKSVELPRGTRFNHALRGPIHIGSVPLSLREVRAVRDVVPGATVNDAVTAIIGRALFETLTELDGGEPAVPLYAASPFQADDLTADANSFSEEIVELHGDESDPIERLRRVHASTAAAKARVRSEDAIAFRALQTRLAPTVLGLSRKRAQRSGVAEAGVDSPAASTAATLISNVRSDLVDATFLGDPVIDQLMWLNIGDRMTLQHVVTSLGDRLTINVTADLSALRDLDDYLGKLRHHAAVLTDACVNTIH